MYFIASSLSEWSRIRRTGDEGMDTLASGSSTCRSSAATSRSRRHASGSSSGYRSTMVERPALPLTVAAGWRPRSEAWLERAPSRFASAPARPLFIGACPRSGTTLLRVLLDNHPDLAIPHETNFVRPLWWQRVRFGDLRDPANRRRVAEWIFTEKSHRSARLRDGRISRRDAIRRVADALPTVGSIVQACLQLRAEADGKPRWGDKRPSYSGFIGMLFAMFPDGQYINLVRDPRGAVASQMPMGWDAPEVAVAAATARWEAAIRRTDHFARRLRS